MIDPQTPPAVESLLKLLAARAADVGLAFWLGLSTPLVWAILASWVPWIRRPAPLLLFATISAAVSFPLLMGWETPAWLVVNLIAFGCAKVLVGMGNAPSRRWNYACLFMALGAVLYVGVRSIDPAHSVIRIGRIGLPWAVFEMFLGMRILTLLWETGSGKVGMIDNRRFVIWASMPFTCFGPLLRYSQFEQQWDRLTDPNLRVGPSGFAWCRQWVAVLNMLCTLVLLQWLASIVRHSDGMPNLVRVLVTGYITDPWSFLLASWLALRSREILAQRVGLTLPQSFDNPFGRSNLSDFWKHWNMSVTAVFRDYFFFNRWGFKTVNPYLNSILVFAFVGLWHASNFYWISWGLLHGVGFALFMAYQKHRDRFVPAAWRSWIEGNVWLSSAATYLYVTSLWLVPPQVQKLLPW